MADGFFLCKKIKVKMAGRPFITGFPGLALAAGLLAQTATGCKQPCTPPIPARLPLLRDI